MDLRYIEAFVAAAEEGHFGRAAARQLVAPSTLSRQVQALEGELDLALFDRSGRAAMLTPAGAAFLPEARTLIAQAEAASTLARRVAEGREGRVRVGFIGPAMFGVLPAALRAHRERAPDVSVALTEMRSADQRASLLAGELDVAVLHGGLGPGTVDVPLARAVLREEARMLAVMDGHPLGRHPPSDGGGPVSLAALADIPIVFFERSFEPVHFDAFVGACKAAGFEPVFGQHANRIYVVLALVAAGLGVAPVTEPVARTLRYPNVSYRMLEGAGPGLSLVAVWRPDQSTPAVDGFLKTLRRVGSQE